MKKFNRMMIVGLATIIFAGCHTLGPNQVEPAEEVITFQEGTSPVPNSRYYTTVIRAMGNVNLETHGLRLFVNGNRQRVMVWNARAVGLWRSDRLSEGFYGARVGIISDAPCEDFVCRAGISNGDVLRIRLDVCDAQECTEGVEREMRVEIIPL